MTSNASVIDCSREAMVERLVERAVQAFGNPYTTERNAIRAAINEAIDRELAVERETCAEICDDHAAHCSWPNSPAPASARECARRIRERGKR